MMAVNARRTNFPLRALLFPLLVIMLAGLALGVVVFNKVQKSFMDTV